MDIRLPKLPRWGVRALRWSNLPLIGPIKRIDLLIAAAGVGATAYYWYTAGPLGALTGAAVFAFVAMIALWM